VYEGIVEITESRSRRRTNELLAAGYALLHIDAVTHVGPGRESRPQYRRSHEYVLGRRADQAPFAEVFGALAAESGERRAESGESPPDPVGDESGGTYS
jgi:hypothetical protein